MQNALAVVDTENDVEIQLRATSRQLCEDARSVIIMDRMDLSEATDLVKMIKTRFRDIEDERTRLVKPFNDGVKAINGRFKAMQLPLEEAESDLKRKMLAFQKEEERKAEEERRRIEAEQRRRDEEERKRREAEDAKRIAEATDGEPQDRAAPPVPAPSYAPPVQVASSYRPTTHGQTGATSTVKKIWKYRLFDIKALAAARPDLVTVDSAKINQEIKGRGGIIPGLEIYEDDVLSVR